MTSRAFFRERTSERTNELKVSSNYSFFQPAGHYKSTACDCLIRKREKEWETIGTELSLRSYFIPLASCSRFKPRRRRRRGGRRRILKNQCPPSIHSLVVTYHFHSFVPFISNRFQVTFCASQLDCERRRGRPAGSGSDSGFSSSSLVQVGRKETTSFSC